MVEKPEQPDTDLEPGREIVVGVNAEAGVLEVVRKHRVRRQEDREVEVGRSAECCVRFSGLP